MLAVIFALAISPIIETARAQNMRSTARGSTPIGAIAMRGAADLRRAMDADPGNPYYRWVIGE